MFFSLSLLLVRCARYRFINQVCVEFHLNTIIISHDRDSIEKPKHEYHAAHRKATHKSVEHDSFGLWWLYQSILCVHISYIEYHSSLYLGFEYRMMFWGRIGLESNYVLVLSYNPTNITWPSILFFSTPSLMLTLNTWQMRKQSV